MTEINWENLIETELVQIAEKLKRDKNCFIIAHNYQKMEVQQIADFVGDSLQMAKVAAQTDADMILVCGIKIMAETAKILNPGKKVLMAHPTADCQLANMQTPADLLKLKTEYPDAEVVCYVNSPATLKAESTITCTSSNAVDLVNKLPANKPIIFVPDRNIGTWVQHQTGRELIMFDSFCYVHDQISLAEVKKIRLKYPEHKLLVHPECRLDVCLEADLVCSTSQMIDFTKANDKVIIGTEYGLYEQMKYHFPKKDIVALSPRMICEDMKKTTLMGAVKALANDLNEVIVDDLIMQKSNYSLNRMLEIV
ncbi:MAG: quinolinate synthase [Candidatus Cloacimonas sp. 4484_143]|nr:MAG: quinolinate synthase [Candidatus Cloacimonas sp. 4484_143]RLC52669.1 MAG: quinolinate synthase [Candidatus Cloacimonadota bacterium]